MNLLNRIGAWAQIIIKFQIKHLIDSSITPVLNDDTKNNYKNIEIELKTNHLLLLLLLLNNVKCTSFHQY